MLVTEAADKLEAGEIPPELLLEGAEFVVKVVADLIGRGGSRGARALKICELQAQQIQNLEQEVKNIKLQIQQLLDRPTISYNPE